MTPNADTVRVMWVHIYLGRRRHIPRLDGSGTTFCQRVWTHEIVGPPDIHYAICQECATNAAADTASPIASSGTP